MEKDLSQQRAKTSAVRDPRKKPAEADARRLAPIVAKLATAIKAEAIILFGSRARGDHHKNSDYDLYVLVKDDALFVERPEFWLWELTREFKEAIDVFIMEAELFEHRRRSINRIEHDAFEDGVLIFERDGARPTTP